ncbi:MAG: hypothetical protein WCP03_01310, partial [Candidatus Saccharibacteria bacterium]
THDLANDIKEADALIVSGYFPHKKILNYFDGPKKFLGYSDTIYDLDDDKYLDDEDKNNINYNRTYIDDLFRDRCSNYCSCRITTNL